MALLLPSGSVRKNENENDLAHCRGKMVAGVRAPAFLELVLVFAGVCCVPAPSIIVAVAALLGLVLLLGWRRLGWTLIVLL